MATKIWIDRNTGSIHIGDVAVLEANQAKVSVEPLVANLVERSRDHGNGYEWLYFRDLTFGGQPAALSICFHDGHLEQASWSVQLPDAPMESGWPTKGAIDSEISFVREVLARQMEIHVGQKPWGEIWSSFDAKAFMAVNGLRYRRSSRPQRRWQLPGCKVRLRSGVFHWLRKGGF